MSSLDTMKTVTDILTAHGFKASLEYPGAIHIELRERVTLVAGDMNEKWGADVHLGDCNTGEQHCDESIDTEVSSHEEDAHVIAGALSVAIRAWDAKHPTVEEVVIIAVQVTKDGLTDKSMNRIREYIEGFTPAVIAANDITTLHRESRPFTVQFSDFVD